MVSESHVVPSAYTKHRPVAGSQVPEGSMHGEADDLAQPSLKQSPSCMSSRAKSPVKLDPDVYLVRGNEDREQSRYFIAHHYAPRPLDTHV